MKIVNRSGLLVSFIAVLLLTGCPEKRDALYPVAEEEYLIGWYLHNIDDSTPTELNYSYDELATYRYSLNYPAESPAYYENIMFWVAPFQNFASSPVMRFGAPQDRVYYLKGDPVAGYGRDWSFANWMDIRYGNTADLQEEHYGADNAFYGIRPVPGASEHIYFGTMPLTPVSVIADSSIRLNGELLRGYNSSSYLDRQVTDMSKPVPHYRIYHDEDLVMERDLIDYYGNWHHNLEYYLDEDGVYRVIIEIPSGYPVFEMVKINTSFVRNGSNEIGLPVLKHIEFPPRYVTGLVLPVDVEFENPDEVYQVNKYYRTIGMSDWVLFDGALTVESPNATSMDFRFEAYGPGGSAVYEIMPVSLRTVNVSCPVSGHFIRDGVTTVAGTCIDQNDKPVEGLRLEFHHRSEHLGAAMTDETGYYNFTIQRIMTYIAGSVKGTGSYPRIIFDSVSICDFDFVCEGLENSFNCPHDCGYPAHCTNGYKDYNETGDDCGGPCPPCNTYADLYPRIETNYLTQDEENQIYITVSNYGQATATDVLAGIYLAEGQTDFVYIDEFYDGDSFEKELNDDVNMQMTIEILNEYYANITFTYSGKTVEQTVFEDMAVKLYDDYLVNIWDMDIEAEGGGYEGEDLYMEFSSDFTEFSQELEDIQSWDEIQSSFNYTPPAGRDRIDAFISTSCDKDMYIRNNHRARYLEILPREPDMEGSIYTRNSHYFVGENITLRYWLRNRGADPALNVSYRIYLDNELIKTEYLGAQTYDDYLWDTASSMADAPGNYNVSLHIDCANDNNYSNNHYSTIAEVYEGLPTVFDVEYNSGNFVGYYYIDGIHHYISEEQNGTLDVSVAANLSHLITKSYREYGDDYQHYAYIEAQEAEISSYNTDSGGMSLAERTDRNIDAFFTVWNQVDFGYQESYIYINVRQDPWPVPENASLYSCAEFADGSCLVDWIPVSEGNVYVYDDSMWGYAYLDQEEALAVGTLLSEKTDGYASIATLKDTYMVGERIELTDPPEELRTEPASLNGLISHSQYTKKQAEYVPGELLVKFKSDPQVNVVSSRGGASQVQTKFSSVNTLSQEFNVREMKQMLSSAKNLGSELGRIYKLTMDASVEDAARGYNQDPNVLYAEPNFLAHTTFVPNDPFYSQQWAHQNTDAEQGWDIERGSPDVRIAIIDTGVAFNHEDLAANMAADCSDGCPLGQGYDFVDIVTQAYIDLGYQLIAEEDYTEPDNDPYDYHGHGTHCAGIAAGVGNNGIGISGVCPDCSVLPVRAGFSIMYGSREYGNLEYDDIANAIVYAVDNGADVISMSFGGSSSQTMEDAISYAHSSGAVLVASAGNSDSDYESYPAAYDEVISVAATAQDDSKAYYSNYGFWVDLAAPGGDTLKDSRIYSTVPTEGGTLSNPSGYTRAQGTSMAAPYVAGAAGLVLSDDNTLNNEEVRFKLEQGTDPASSNLYIGTGRVNNDKSLNIQAIESVANISTPTAGQYITENIDIIGTATGNSYAVYYGEGVYPQEWAEIETGTSVINGVLATWDIGSIQDGPYTIRLRVEDFEGFVEKRVLVQVVRGYQDGWPIDFLNTQSAVVSHSPTIVDINNDEDYEVITAGSDELGGIVSIYSNDGQQLDGWPQRTIGTAQFGVSVADINNDGIMEIVATTTSSYGRIYVWNAFGELLWSKELESGYPHLCSVLSDVNNDGFMEIITQTWESKLFIVDHMGNNLLGWPTESKEYDITARDCPVAVDFDNDGLKEIVVTGVIDAGYETGDIWRRYNGSLTVFNHDATARWKKMWPQESQTTEYYSRAIRTSPVVADVDNNGEYDIIVAQEMFNANNLDDRVYKNRYYIFNMNGEILPGWPKETDSLGDLTKNPVVANLDSDDELEIIGQGKKDLFVWNHDGTALIAPVQMNADDRHGEAVIGIPSVADVTGDGLADIIVYSHKNCRYSGCQPEPGIYVVDNDGTMYSQDWPKYDKIVSVLQGMEKIQKEYLTEEQVFETLGKRRDYVRWADFFARKKPDSVIFKEQVLYPPECIDEILEKHDIILEEGKYIDIHRVQQIAIENKGMFSINGFLQMLKTEKVLARGTGTDRKYLTLDVLNAYMG